MPLPGSRAQSKIDRNCAAKALHLIGLPPGSRRAIVAGGAATHGFRGLVTPNVDGWAVRCSPHILDPYGRGACDACPGLSSLKVAGTDLRRFTNSPITKDQV